MGLTLRFFLRRWRPVDAEMLAYERGLLHAANRGNTGIPLIMQILGSTNLPLVFPP